MEPRIRGPPYLYKMGRDHWYCQAQRKEEIPMTERTAMTPMHRLFDRLRQRIKETEAKIAELENKREVLQLLESDLVDRHSEIEPVLNFYAEEFVGAEGVDKTPLAPIEKEEEIPRIGPTEAVRQFFASADTQMTTAEVRDALEDMRQQGHIETQVKHIDSDKTGKILRQLIEQNFLVKGSTTEGNQVVRVYRRAEKG